MAIEIVTIPCLSDNYAFLIHESDNGETALVDAPEAAPILTALSDRGWTLNWILLTHHHADHIQGVPEILGRHDAKVVGNSADAGRLPPLDRAVSDGDTVTICGQAVEVWDVSGHTIGHIAYVMRDQKAAFTADSLMALGCGRVFEGTFDQMWNSLSKFQALADDTMIYSGHEYTAANARFALSVDPDNADLRARATATDAARAAGEATVPSALGTERSTNPFLRASDAKMKKALGLESASDAEVFAEIRQRKDNF